jgi:hypothetical protein
VDRRIMGMAPKHTLDGNAGHAAGTRLYNRRSGNSCASAGVGAALAQSAVYDHCDRPWSAADLAVQLSVSKVKVEARRPW